MANFDSPREIAPTEALAARELKRYIIFPSVHVQNRIVVENGLILSRYLRLDESAPPTDRRIPTAYASDLAHRLREKSGRPFPEREEIIRQHALDPKTEGAIRDIKNGYNEKVLKLGGKDGNLAWNVAAALAGVNWRRIERPGPLHDSLCDEDGHIPVDNFIERTVWDHISLRKKA